MRTGKEWCARGRSGVVEWSFKSTTQLRSQCPLSREEEREPWKRGFSLLYGENKVKFCRPISIAQNRAEGILFISHAYLLIYFFCLLISLLHS